MLEDKERIIKRVRRVMGEPIVYVLDDNDYERLWDLSNNIVSMFDKWIKEGKSIRLLVQRRVMEELCRDLILQKTNGRGFEL